MSACLGHPIALALVAGGHSRTDETIYASLVDGTVVPVKIVPPVFYDPKSERQND
jgi:sarcosine oxidase subunit alpha